jgi:hypothetical protein
LRWQNLDMQVTMIEKKMTRYEIKTDLRSGEERRLMKLNWAFWKYLCFTWKTNRRKHQRRMPKFAAVNHTTGHYVIYK